MLSDGLVCLTQTEAIIIRMVGNGKTAKEIADMIGLKCPTVNEHLKRCRKRFGANSSSHLVAIASLCGVIKRVDIEGANVDVTVNAPKVSPQ